MIASGAPRPAAWLACVVLWWAPVAWAQQTEIHKPLSPIGPASEDDCRALDAQWAEVCQQISRAHQQCLDAYEGTSTRDAGECSRAPCLPLHQEMTGCANERSQPVQACYEQVRVRREQEAAFQRAQQEAQREYQRRVEADTAQFVGEANAARQRADAYRRVAAAVPNRPEGLDASQANLLQDLRQRAEAASTGLSNAADRVREAWESVDLSRLEASGREVIANEGRDALMFGLSQSERWAWVSELVDVNQKGLDAGQWLSDVYRDLQEAPGDWGGAFDRLRTLARIPVEIPNLHMMVARSTIETGGRLKDGYRSALQRFDAYMGQVLAGGTPDDPTDAMVHDILGGALGNVLPIDRLERLKRFADDASYTWRSGKDAFSRLFSP